MKLLLKFILVILLTGLVLFISCSKVKLAPPSSASVVPPPQIPGVDSSLRGHEFVFSRTWFLWTDEMGSDIYIYVSPMDSFSCASMAGLKTEVSLQFDTSSNWIAIPQWDWYGTGVWPSMASYAWSFRHYPYYDNNIFWVNNHPLNYQLVGRPVKVKIRFL
jgi:hypothetical protein